MSFDPRLWSSIRAALMSAVSFSELIGLPRAVTVRTGLLCRRVAERNYSWR